MFLINLNEYDEGWARKEAKKADFTVRIPRAYAREETNVRPNIDKLDQVDCYELYVVRQERRVSLDTYVFYRLPSGTMITILLKRDGTVDFNPRILALRELDKLDREILIGFCYKYYSAFMNASHYDTSWIGYRDSLLHYGAYFRRSSINKRINNHRKRLYIDGYEDERGENTSEIVNSFKEAMINTYRNIEFI